MKMVLSRICKFYLILLSIVLAIAIVYYLGFQWKGISLQRISAETALQFFKRKKKTIKVPNVVHFIWYATQHQDFSFLKYLSILSVYKFQKPDKIYFHTNCTPKGIFWDRALAIPSFVVKDRKPTTQLFGRKLKQEGKIDTSDSNIDRIRVLMEYGGTYLDTDILVVRSFDELRTNRCVMGRETPGRLCAAFILCGAKSAFLKLWLEHYIVDHHPEKWAYNSGQVSTQLAGQYPTLLHIEDAKLMRPNYVHLEQIYGNQTYDWRDNYTIHLWNHMLVGRESKYKKDLNSPGSLHKRNSTLYQVARHIYYS